MGGYNKDGHPSDQSIHPVKGTVLRCMIASLFIIGTTTIYYHYCYQYDINIGHSWTLTINNRLVALGMKHQASLTAIRKSLATIVHLK